jgi:HK97 gp10 family phage protein
MGDGLMAKMAVMAGEDFAILLSKLEAKSEEIAAKAIFAGAEIVADQIKSNLTGVLSKEATGEMLESFGVTPIGKDKDGNWNAHVGFDGYSGKASKSYPKGTPNQLKARVLESGSSRQRKRPFVRPAIRSTKAEVIRKMNQIIKESIEKL